MDSNLQKYIAFLKTAQYKSFTRAAQHLHYSQSGISRMIHDLEQEWHVQLFERKHGTVDLTSDGISILPQVQALCSEIMLKLRLGFKKGAWIAGLSTYPHAPISKPLS